MSKIEVGWLIEEPSPAPPRWWAGSRYGWTTDASRAVRFCREQDAQRVVESMGWLNTEVVITDHRWV